MAEYYYIAQKIVTLENSITLGKIDSDIDLEPVNLLSGTKLSTPPTYIDIELSATSGDYYPDIISSLITLYSTKIKNCFDNCGIDNIDYYPVNIIDKKTNSVNTDYWFANICERIRCVDIEKSDTKKNAFGTLKFKSFSIDEAKTNGAALFRLDEKGTLVIIHERIHKAFIEIGTKGIIIENTKKFDGHGM